METFESAKKFCTNPPSDNPPKRGKKYYFENDNSKTFATEIEHELFKPNTFAARLFIAKYVKVLIDGVYQNNNGTFAGYWYKNGTYRTCDVSEILPIDCQEVLSVGFV